MSYWKERGPKFHKKMLIIFHQQEINFKFISPGGLQPKTLDHFQGTQNTVLWKSPNMEGQRNVFVFWLERQSSLSASGFTAIASSLGSTVVSEGSMSKRQGRLTGSYRGESDGDGRFGHRLCREDPLEKELAAHSSILAWKIPWTMEPGRLHGVSKSQKRLRFPFPFQSTSCKILGWMKHKLEPRLLGEISITSDMQITPPLWQKAKKN